MYINSQQKDLTGSVFEISPKTKSKLAKLVGVKCLVNINISNCNEKVLWDTGAQVSLISRQWEESKGLGSQIKHLIKLFKQELVIKSVSGES